MNKFAEADIKGMAMIKDKNGIWGDKTMETLCGAVVTCCGAWGLYDQSDCISQKLKALSECGEACDSVNKGDREQLKDDIGDIIVCLINWSELCDVDFMMAWNDNGLDYDCGGAKYCVSDLMACIANTPTDKLLANLGSIICFIKELAGRFGLRPVECLGLAYDVISKRKGRMINGTFVKDADQ